MSSNGGRDRLGEFSRHRGPVTCVAGLPDGGAVSSGYDGAVGIVAPGSRRIDLLGYHDHLVNKVVVNEAGTLAATPSSDHTIGLWDLRRRNKLRMLLGHSDDVEDFAFIDDRTGVSVSRDWRVLVWDLETGAIVRVLQGHEKDVLSVVAAGGRIFTSGDDMTLRMWAASTGDLIRRWGPFENETDSCAIDTARGRAVLGCDDGVIRIFDVDGDRTLAEIPAHASGIKKVAVSPKTGDILSAAYDQRIIIWDATTFGLRRELERRATVWERSFNWAPDGSQILAGTFDGTVLVWDAATGRCVDEIGDRGRGNACLNDVSANADGDLATVSDDGFIRLGRLTPDEAAWSAVVEPTGGRMLANAITLDDRSGLVVAGAHDQNLHIFDRDGGRLVDGRSVRLGEGPINCVRVSRHPGFEAHTFVACYSGAIVRVDRRGEVVQKIRLHEGAVKALRLHPHDRIGVSCSADGALIAWDFDGNVVREFPGHMAIVDDVDVAPSGRRIVSVSRDFTAKVYDLESGALLHSFPLGRHSPKGVCFFDDDAVIVTNYWGALLRIDLASGRIRSRTIAENGISAASRCGGDLVAVSYDGAAYLVDPSDLSVVNDLRCMTQRLAPSALIRPESAQLASAGA